MSGCRLTAFEAACSRAQAHIGTPVVVREMGTEMYLPKYHGLQFFMGNSTGDDKTQTDRLFWLSRVEYLPSLTVVMLTIVAFS